MQFIVLYAWAIIATASVIKFIWDVFEPYKPDQKCDDINGVSDEST